MQFCIDKLSDLQLRHRPDQSKKQFEKMWTSRLKRFTVDIATDRRSLADLRGANGAMAPTMPEVTSK